jgi:phosphoglycerate dehydrogenase-like enzyme
VIEQLPNLKWIHEGTGHPPDIAYSQAYRSHITITHTGNVFGISVAEMALSLFLASYRRITDHDRMLHTEDGKEGESISLNREAYGKTAGIIGFGNIGKRLAYLLRSIGMRVIAYDPFLHNDPSSKDMDVAFVDLTDLLSSSDGIFVAASPAPDNKHLLDVFPIEPLPPGDPLRRLDNVILIPHRAGGTNEARQRMGWDFIHDLEVYLRGGLPIKNFNVTRQIALERGYMTRE